MRLSIPAVTVILLESVAAAAEPAVDYTREIRPILADRCYACHGPDSAKRKAKLRLDQRDEAIKIAIKPGNAADSPIVKRISSAHDDEMMPPPIAKKPRLSPEQVQLIKRWIDQGAK